VYLLTCIQHNHQSPAWAENRALRRAGRAAAAEIFDRRAERRKFMVAVGVGCEFALCSSKLLLISKQKG